MYCELVKKVAASLRLRALEPQMESAVSKGAPVNGGRFMKMKITPATLVDICLGFSVILSGVTLAQDPNPQMSSNNRVPAAFHEFEMFGDTSVYLSHYPMFGSIHSYQALLEVKLSGDGNDPRQLYLSHKQKNPTARYSVSPATPNGENNYWVLPEMMKKGKSFRANIHWQKSKGHPLYISRNVTVEITKIIHFRLFQPDDKKSDVLTYLLFGNDSEAFLAHYIGSYPDFDQILAVTINSKKLHLNDSAAVTIVTIPGRANKKSLRLLQKDNAVIGRVNRDGDELKISVGTQIHYET